MNWDWVQMIWSHGDLIRNLKPDVNRYLRKYC
jgi:hypothetical protein